MNEPNESRITEEEFRVVFLSAGVLIGALSDAVKGYADKKRLEIAMDAPIKLLREYVQGEINKDRATLTAPADRKAAREISASDYEATYKESVIAAEELSSAYAAYQDAANDVDAVIAGITSRAPYIHYKDIQARSEWIEANARKERAFDEWEKARVHSIDAEAKARAALFTYENEIRKDALAALVAPPAEEERSENALRNDTSDGKRTGIRRRRRATIPCSNKSTKR
jgi:hypothetical protein